LRVSPFYRAEARKREAIKTPRLCASARTKNGDDATDWLPSKKRV
jgi:hypothetical protein